MKYVIATLIGNHKTYSIPKLFEGIDNLNQQPERIFVSTTPEVFEQCPKGVHIQGPNDTGNDTIVSTTSAREEIRQRGIEYMEANGIEWMLWLDNDIVVPVDLIEKAEKLIKSQPYICLINSFHPSRINKNELRHGMACTFTHIDSLKSYPFTLMYIRGSYLGDDQIWLMVQHRVLGSKWRDNVSMAAGVLFDVVHLVEDGSENIVLMKDKGKLL